MKGKPPEPEQVDDLTFLEAEASGHLASDLPSGFEVLDAGGERRDSVPVGFKELDEAQRGDRHGKSRRKDDRNDRRRGINSHQDQFARDFDAEIVAHPGGFFPKKIGRGQGIVLMLMFDGFSFPCHKSLTGIVQKNASRGNPVDIQGIMRPTIPLWIRLTAMAASKREKIFPTALERVFPMIRFSFSERDSKK